MIEYDKLEEVIEANKRITEIIMELIPQYYKLDEFSAMYPPKEIIE